MKKTYQQLLDEVSKKHFGISFLKISEGDMRQIAEEITDEKYGHLDDEKRKSRLNGKPYIISVSSMKEWRTKPPSESHSNILARHLGYQNFKDFIKNENEQLGKRSTEHIGGDLRNGENHRFNLKTGIIFGAFVMGLGLLLASLSSANSLSELAQSISNALATRLGDSKTQIPKEKSSNEVPAFVSYDDSVERRPLKVLEEQETNISDASPTTEPKPESDVPSYEITVFINEKYVDAQFFQEDQPIVPKLAGMNLFTFDVKASQLEQKWEARISDDTCTHRFIPNASKKVHFQCE